MGRALTFARTSDLPRLFTFFGIEADRDEVQACAERIVERFRVEAGEIERRCTGLRERERFVLLRAALLHAYERARLMAGAAVAPR